MKLLADLHISPRTVLFLRNQGYDVIRVSEVLPPTAPDIEIIEYAAQENRTILTQDLDFSALIAIGGRQLPSVISLRLTSSLVDAVNAILQRILPSLEEDVAHGVLISVTSHRVRTRKLPLR